MKNLEADSTVLIRQHKMFEIQRLNKFEEVIFILLCLLEVGFSLLGGIPDDVGTTVPLFDPVIGDGSPPLCKIGKLRYLRST